AVTAGGGLLDLRYQVVDPSKAVAVHEARTPPAIIDERTGLVLNRLLMGHAHHGQLKPAVSYYLIFENTGNWVRPGSEVTVLLGDAQVEHIVVKCHLHAVGDEDRTEREGAFGVRILLRSAALALVAAAATLLLAQPASAHADLVRSDPPNGGVLTHAPSVARLW